MIDFKRLDEYITDVNYMIIAREAKNLIQLDFNSLFKGKLA